jgi:U3 small nucleolar RNA-associated protein 3
LGGAAAEETGGGGSARPHSAPVHTALLRLMARSSMGGRSTPGKTPTKSAAKQGGHEAWMDDEVDTHQAGRDKISLNAGDDADSDDEDEEAAGVMDIAADDSDDDSDDEDDDDDEEEGNEEGGKAGGDGEDESEGDDEEEAALIRAMKAQQKKLNSKGAAREPDSDDDESESEEAAPGIRGKKKADFYQSVDDDVDHEGLSDEEDRKDEEREARRLQSANAAGMRASDFGLDDDSEEEEEEATLGAQAKKLSTKGKAAAAAAAKKKASAVKKKGGVGAMVGASIESLGGDEMAAGAAAAGNVVASDAPELIALTRELTKNLDEVQHSIEPVIAMVRAGDYATADGISYLDAKHLLMLSYCINIVFYLLLKAEAGGVLATTSTDRRCASPPSPHPRVWMNIHPEGKIGGHI